MARLCKKAGEGVINFTWGFLNAIPKIITSHWQHYLFLEASFTIFLEGLADFLTTLT